MSKIERNIVSGLAKINYTMTTNFIRKQYEKQYNKTNIKYKKTNIIRFNKIKYKLPNIKLKGKYLERYKTLLLDNYIFLDLV